MDSQGFFIAPQSRKVGMAFFALLDMHLSICEAKVVTGFSGKSQKLNIHCEQNSHVSIYTQQADSWWNKTLSAKGIFR